MKTVKLLFLLLLVLVSQSVAKIRIVASTADLASIAEQIGADRVKVSYICPPSANPHSVEVLPSYMIRVIKADMYLKIGMMLDFWADPIIDGSRNRDLKVVDCSIGVDPLEVPVGKVDASMGDIHAAGNPHYWLDPDNGIIIAGNIRDALLETDPEHQELYNANYDSFTAELNEKIRLWEQVAAPLSGMKIVTYHNSWVYFAHHFGINVVGFVEPKPGIEPTPSHTAKLIDLINAQSIQIVGMEPYFSKRAPDAIAAATGVRVVMLPPSVWSTSEINSYFDLFDFLIKQLIRSMEDDN